MGLASRTFWPPHKDSLSGEDSFLSYSVVLTFRSCTMSTFIFYYFIKYIFIEEASVTLTCDFHEGPPLYRNKGNLHKIK